ncbi:S8 family peptidase [Croceicoccus marinus]|nr:S8 family peptidase [Croceicoccus marinus]
MDTGRPARCRAAYMLAALSALAMLSACGGGGGSGGGPISTPTPAPAPQPAPTPDIDFDTAEFRRSDGPALHDAVAAWQDGATGRGVGIAIIDTGIDPDNPEFAGRISSASRDVAGDRGIDSPDGHGTQVALVAAAARNDRGVMGMAYDATIIAFRADLPGTCQGFDPVNPVTGCSFNDSDIARGVNLAVSAGARVINISLGGSNPSSVLRSALASAAEAGAVIVVSAGNDGEGGDLSIDPENPDPFAIGTLRAGGANVIIAGSVDAEAQISSFSNKAGRYAASFLAAQGEDVCCVYQDGQIYTETRDGTDFVYVVNGTSFAAPQIAGAAALLAQAFPNLSGAEIVSLLLDNARDAGERGTDAIYGRGVLDIGAAFAPSGTTTLAGHGTALSLATAAGSVSPAMGDAGQQGTTGAILLDGYGRAYSVDLAGRLRSAAPRRDFARSLMGSARGASLQAGGLGASFAVADGIHGGPGGGPPQLRSEDAAQAQLLAARISARIAPGTEVAFGFRQGASGLEASLRGADRPAFMVAQEPGTDLGFAAMNAGSMAIRREMGGWGLTLSGEAGAVWNERLDDELAILPARRNRLARYGVSADARKGAIDASLGASWLHEDTTLLGGSFQSALVGRGGADSMFLDLAAGWDASPGWRFGLSVRQGLTRPIAGGLMTDAALLHTSGWSIDAARSGIFTRQDRLALRVSQPLRVESGALALNLPVAYDYASESATMGISRLSLSPTGREIATELSWEGPVWGGTAAASLFMRRDPGHVASASADMGAGLRWSRAF